MDPPTRRRDAFFLENYVPEAIEGAASSQTATLNFGRVKVSRKRDKKKDEQRRDKSYPASFKVPDLPNKPSLPLPDLPSSESSASKEIPLPSLSENFSTSPPSTPVHSRFLPAIDLHLDEPFAIADDRYHHPILFQHTPSRINTSVHLRDNLFNSPATPALTSTPDSEPLSSPETVLSTPQSTIFDWQPVSGPDFFESNSPNSAHAQAIPKEVDHARKALEALSVLGMSPFHLIDTLLNAEYSTYFRHHRTAFFRRDSTLIPHLLTHIFDDSIGHQLFLKWLPPNFIRDEFCGRISEQMEAAKPFFWMNADKFSVDFLQKFDLRRDVSAYAEEHLSDWTYALKAATGCLGSEKKEADTELGRLVMTCQAMNFRSIQSSKLQLMLGIYAWATGTSKQTVEVLGASGLSVSHPTIMKTVDIVAEQSIADARSLSFEPHVATYDNIDISGSEHVEQRKDAVSKVRSGCFYMIYRAHGVKDRSHMLLEPMVQNLRKCIPLTIADVSQTRNQAACYLHQSIITVIRALSDHLSVFKHLESHPDLQYKSRRALPPNLKTEFHPIRTTTIEEKSIQGNLENQDDFYIRQMGRDPMDPELSKWAVPSFNDQLTNSRIRSCVIVRQGDLNNWLRRWIFALGLAIFHMLMNMIWGLRIKHYGTRDAPGSLAWFFALMEKKRLAGEKPDFYALSAALSQILNGILLTGWIRECGYPSLQEFAESNPQPDVLKEIASRILLNYCTPILDPRIETSVDPTPPAPRARQKKATPSASTPNSTAVPKSKSKGKAKAKADSEVDTGPDDPCHRNLRLLARDLLVVAEVTAAIPVGDFGRIEDLLPVLAAMFASIGSQKYAIEIVTLIHNLKYVWTPEFADIMRDNHLVNISGLPNHFMAIDMNIEHHIGYVKALYTAKGVHADWEHLGNIAAGIVSIQNCKKKVGLMMDVSYKKKTASEVDTKSISWDVVRWLMQEDLLSFDVGRKKCSPAPDLRETQKLFAMVPRFNKRAKELWGDDVATETDDILDEVDEIAPMEWGAAEDSEE